MAEARFEHQQTSLLFPTPLLTYRIADAAWLNAQLLAEIAARRDSDRGVVRSNRGGWASEADFFVRPEPGHRALAAAIRDMVVAASLEIGGDIERIKRANFRIVGWINVNPPQAYNAPHDHPGCFWSGAYYIATAPGDGGNTAGGDAAGGEIAFIDPRCPPTGQALVSAPMFAGHYSLRPQPGSLLLFPSNAKHWVHPNGSGGERVTMAFNVFITNQREGRGAAAR